MEGWMIALIVVAGVILLVAVAIPVAAYVSFKKILGRRGENKMKGVSADMYGVDLDWFELDDIKRAKDELSITSYDDLTLRAVYFKHEETPRKVAICQHGYWATPRSVQPYARLFYDMGFDVIMPAARAHDISDGDAVGMAWLDRFDILRWIDKAIELYGADVQIALFGISMGGATVIAASGMGLPPQVKCVIDDCGFCSQRDEYLACAKNVHVPGWLALFLLGTGVRMKCGYSVNDADIRPLAAQMTIPALFFHGEKDAFVPFELGKKLFDACGSNDKTFEAFDAEHALSYVSDKERYSKLFTEFVTKHVPDETAE